MASHHLSGIIFALGLGVSAGCGAGEITNQQGADAASPDGATDDASTDDGSVADGGGTSDGTVDPGTIVPADRRITWDPGVPGGIPDVAIVCPAGAPSVTEFGAVGDGVTDDAQAFIDAIAAAGEGDAIRIPAATYLLESGLTIDKGIVLCGEGADVSRLQFDTAATGISIVKYDRGEFVAVTAGFTKDSEVLTVSDASFFQVGEYAELQQSNNWDEMDPEEIWRYDSWVPEGAVGQMFQVVAIDGNQLTVDPPLHLDYDAAYDPVIRPMGLVEGAGLQGLYLTRLDSNDYGTVEIKNAVGCWVRSCESDTTYRAHVGLTSALWCEVRDSYMHDSHDHGGGGHGYGANLGNHTTASLIENNVFVSLRHSMLVQVGATGNVFGYNYSIDPIQSEGGSWTPCDISLHGHYPNMNLFEANLVQEIDVSDYWGPCGPGNTFLRNRVDSEGIQVMDYSHRQNLVGNELGEGVNVVVVEASCDETLIHGNFQEGAIQWDPSITDQELPRSLYLAEKPPFFGDTPWPITGADLVPGGGPLPAEERYLAGDPVGP